MAEAGEIPGADGPLYFAPEAPEVPLSTQLIVDRMNATFPIDLNRPKTKNLTIRNHHLTPGIVFSGGDEWTMLYWNNINLIIPAEHTLVDPRDPVEEGLGGLTRKWVTANENAAAFIARFFDPRDALPDFDEHSDEFQEWLADWREANHQPAYGPGEQAGSAIPTEKEADMYEIEQDLQLLNMRERLYRNQDVHFEILIMWDFNQAAAPGHVTFPRVSTENIRFYLDMFDAMPIGQKHRLKTHFVFKDIRGGRYIVRQRSKRLYDCDSFLGRQWQNIIRSAVARWERYTETNALRGEEGEGEEAEQIKIARNAKRLMQGTWASPRLLLNRGRLKLDMIDAFRESRHIRNGDPDVVAWMRQRG